MGGNVFGFQSEPIKINNIHPTLTKYFQELTKLFPKKSSIFNLDHFIPLGSVGKKPTSGDIDLGIDSKFIIDTGVYNDCVTDWNLSVKQVDAEFTKLKSRARTSSDNQLRVKAFLKTLSTYINANSNLILIDEQKITDGNIFGLFPQFDSKYQMLNKKVQIDWMIGNIDWLKFSYFSAAYSEDSNIKGLHRTQLLLSSFQLANLSFNHVSGVKDKVTGKIVADNPERALTVLGEHLGITIRDTVAEDYYQLHELLKSSLNRQEYDQLIDIYLTILDSTRADIPDNLQKEWKNRKQRLNLTGKFLPTTSNLKAYL